MSDVPANSFAATPAVQPAGSEAIQMFTPKLKIKKKKLATRKELEKK